MLTEQDLQQCILAVTDKIGGIMDAYKAGLVMVFQCGASGLYYPADYVKAWGIRYGIGLGPHVVSESLQTDYTTPPPEITGAIRSINQIMHPIYSSMAQMDMHLVDPRELAGSQPILAQEDQFYELRAPILRAKQMKNPAGRLAEMHVAYERAKKGN